METGKRTKRTLKQQSFPRVSREAKVREDGRQGGAQVTKEGDIYPGKCNGGGFPRRNSRTERGTSVSWEEVNAFCPAGEGGLPQKRTEGNHSPTGQGREKKAGGTSIQEGEWKGVYIFPHATPSSLEAPR